MRMDQSLSRTEEQKLLVERSLSDHIVGTVGKELGYQLELRLGLTVRLVALVLDQMFLHLSTLLQGPVVFATLLAVFRTQSAVLSQLLSIRHLYEPDRCRLDHELSVKTKRRTDLVVWLGSCLG